MNNLFVLTDKTRLFEREDGFVIVRRDFEIEDQMFDLGFTHDSKPTNDRLYYAVPIIAYPTPKEDAIIYKDIREISALTNRSRFLVKTPEYRKQVLIEVESNIVRIQEYLHGEFNQISKRLPDLIRRLEDVESDFNLISS
ncbi:hypothetical protein J4461_02430 [Candidatus Pacearchaeota archaeon]|nr:hypothetical protein [Candidatus Pacearchaeota archaeon]